MVAKLPLGILSIIFFTASGFASVATKKSEEPNSRECICSPSMISKAFTNVAKKASPAVVFLKVETTAANDDDDAFSGVNPFDDEFFRRFFGTPRGGPSRSMPQISQGSGFLVSADGYLLTNAHVVKGASKITVVFNDGKEMEATLIGADVHTDVAVVKVDGKNLPFLVLGNSDDMEIAEWVIAIGSPFQLEASVTVGVVSAKGRQNLRINDFEDFIQTDAAINPGNSGGPLLNLKAEAIGINTAIFSRNGGYMGIGFSIPSNMAKNIMNQIIESGVVTRGFLGVSLQPIDKDLADAFNLDKPEGALVSEVVKESPADKAGIKQGDIILECDGHSVKSLGGLRNDISMMIPGSTITFTVNRKGKILKIPVVIGNAKESLAVGSSALSKLGLEIDNLSPEMAKQLGYPSTEEGVVITKIKPGSAASIAGIRPGFLIIAVNHRKVTNVADFNKATEDASKTGRILLLVKNGSMNRFYTFKVE